MSDITLINKALQSARVMDEKSTIVHNFINALVVKIYALVGQVPESKAAQNFMVDELKKDVMTRFKGLTLQEVDIALTNGVKGDYGEYYGINIRAFVKFLNEYTFSEERSKALESRHERIDSSRQLTAKGSITTEENERTAVENALHTFVEYKRTKECFDPGNCVYDFLDRLDLIKFTPAEKWGFMEEAKKKMEIERKSLGRTMVISNVMEKQQEGGIVVAYAKKIALKRFFQSLVASGDELKTILENKQ